MLDRLQQQPDDPIIELLMKARVDPSPNVVDLSAGVYKDEAGHTPILDAVRQAEPRRLQNENTRTYQGIIGDERYNSAITELILGRDCPAIAEGRVSTLHTVPLLKTAGVEVLEFPYYDISTNSLMFDEMMDTLGRLHKGSVVLLHGCCHNPSGADLNCDQWNELAELIAARGLIPFVDAAYQGLGSGLEDDAYGWRLLASKVPEMLISYSCSKNFSLYRDRIGALIAISKDKDSAVRTRSNMMSCSRATYSMPAAHGAFLVAEILGDDQLRQSWESELAIMRSRVNQMRSGFARAMSERGYGERFGFVADQFGMFSFLGITADQVIQLREKHSVYMLESSRISIAGLTSANLDYVAESLASVL